MNAFTADKFGREPERADGMAVADGLHRNAFAIDSPAAAMRLELFDLQTGLTAFADQISQTSPTAYLVREASRRLHEQAVEIERLKFHARHLRAAASDAAEYSARLAQATETPGVTLQHVVFSLASALSTSRNLPL